jgi:hypothetical protein
MKNNNSIDKPINKSPSNIRTANRRRKRHQQKIQNIKDNKEKILRELDPNTHQGQITHSIEVITKAYKQLENKENNLEEFIENKEIYKINNIIESFSITDDTDDTENKTDYEFIDKTEINNQGTWCIIS